MADSAAGGWLTYWPLKRYRRPNLESVTTRRFAAWVLVAAGIAGVAGLGVDAWWHGWHGAELVSRELPVVVAAAHVVLVVAAAVAVAAVGLLATGRSPRRSPVRIPISPRWVAGLAAASLAVLVVATVAGPRFTLAGEVVPLWWTGGG